jgi:hypothetical protein
MNAILYGNLTAEAVDGLGTRLERATLRPAAADMLQPRRPAALPPTQLVGRQQQVAAARQALEHRRPIEFNAACGYGKTTLLRHIAAGERGPDGTPAVYLRADTDRVADLLHRLVGELYRADRPVKLTPAECAQMLAGTTATVLVDDICAGPEQVGHLLDVMPRCGFVIAAARPVLGSRGDSQQLAGLPADAALQLIAHALGRPVSQDELPAAHQLTAAVNGQPLHLRQAAALAREGRHSLAALARRAAADPDVLDRLSVNALAEHERRALAILALAAGALLPAGVVDTIGQVTFAAESLASLHKRGLAEQRTDRFGLPVCKAAGYRQMLLEYLHLAASARSLAGLLSAGSLTAGDAEAAVEAALAITEFAAERGEWDTVARLARAAESLLFIAGRWEAWHATLDLGLAAAKAAGDKAAEAFYSHQLGSLAFCQDRLADAQQSLRHALSLREQLGDRAGAELTGHNLRLLDPPPPPPTHRPGGRSGAWRSGAWRAVAGAAGAVTLAVGAVAVTGAVTGHHPHPGPAPTATQTLTSRTTSASSGTSTSPSPGGSTTSPTTLVLPDVTGQTQRQATFTLRRLGLTVSATSVTHCRADDSGTVLAQQPAAGTPVQADSGVGIAVCSPLPPPVLVPNVIGQAQTAATAVLAAEGLAADPAGTDACGADASGTVVDEKPAADTPVRTGSTVTIVVCSAPTPATVVVPDVIGQTQTAATATLEGAGLSVSTSSAFECGAPTVVVGEKPGGGSTVTAGATVTITVCAGPA